MRYNINRVVSWIHKDLEPIRTNTNQCFYVKVGIASITKECFKYDILPLLEAHTNSSISDSLLNREFYLENGYYLIPFFQIENLINHDIQVIIGNYNEFSFNNNELCKIININHYFLLHAYASWLELIQDGIVKI